MTHFDMLSNQLGQWWATLPVPVFRPDMAACAGAATAAVVLLGALLRLRLRRARTRTAALSAAAPRAAQQARASLAEQRVREAMSKAAPQVGSLHVETVDAGTGLSLADLQQQMYMQSSSLVRQDERMQALEQRLASLRQDSVSQPYELAIALAGDGLPAETLARRCGITPAEADLILWLHGSATERNAAVAGNALAAS